MAYNIVENPIKMDDLGGFPIFLETPICCFKLFEQPQTESDCQIVTVSRGGQPVTFLDSRWPASL